MSDQFNAITDLLGGTTQLRVWWRATDDWRVDRLSTTGENDLHRDGIGLWSWDYESRQATLTLAADTAPARLPVAADLPLHGPGAPTAQRGRPRRRVTSIPSRRIAGRDAAGIRLIPDEPESTIERVNVWVDPASGAAMRVEVYGEGTTVLSTQFLDFSPTTPAAADTTFDVPPGVHVRTQQDPDLVAQVNRLGRARPPATLAGFNRNADVESFGSVGVYGHGVTEFAAIPLFNRTAASLRAQLNKAPGVTTSDVGQSITVGPLTLVLGGESGRVSWLLTGTVDQATLARAARELQG